MFYSFPAPSNEASDAGVVAVLLRRQIVTHTCMFLFRGEFLALVKGRARQRSPEPGRGPAGFPAALCQKSPDTNPRSAAALHPPRSPRSSPGASRPRQRSPRPLAVPPPGSAHRSQPRCGPDLRLFNPRLPPRPPRGITARGWGGSAVQTYFPWRRKQLGAKRIRRSSGLKVGEMSAALPNARAEPWLHNTNKPPGDARCSPRPGPEPTPVSLWKGGRTRPCWRAAIFPHAPAAAAGCHLPPPL